MSRKLRIAVIHLIIQFFLDNSKTNSKSINRHNDLPADLRNLYQSHSSRGTRPTVAELSQILTTATQGYSKCLILLDALDECVERRVVVSLLKELSNLQEQQYVSLFATSRDIPEIAENFTKGLTLEIRARDPDMNRFLENHMTSLPASIQRNMDIQALVTTQIVAASDGM